MDRDDVFLIKNQIDNLLDDIAFYAHHIEKGAEEGWMSNTNGRAINALDDTVTKLKGASINLWVVLSSGAWSTNPGETYSKTIQNIINGIKNYVRIMNLCKQGNYVETPPVCENAFSLGMDDTLKKTKDELQKLSDTLSGFIKIRKVDGVWKVKYDEEAVILNDALFEINKRCDDIRAIVEGKEITRPEIKFAVDDFLEYQESENKYLMGEVNNIVNAGHFSDYYGFFVQITVRAKNLMGAIEQIETLESTWGKIYEIANGVRNASDMMRIRYKEMMVDLAAAKKEERESGEQSTAAGRSVTLAAKTGPGTISMTLSSSNCGIASP